MGPIAVLGALVAVAIVKGTQGGKGSKPGAPVTSGTTLLRKGKTYRIQMTASGGIVDDPNHRASAAKAIEEGLKQTGAYDIYMAPSLPMVIEYSYTVAADTPVTLILPSEQSINGVQSTYMFTQVQQISPAARVA